MEKLTDAGYLSRKECEDCAFTGHEEYIDYERIYQFRFKLLKKACKRAFEDGMDKEAEYQAFVRENGWWLENYALFMAVKNYFGGVCFSEWEDDIRLRKKEAVEAYTEKLAEDLAYYRFEQYMFFSQWQALKAYANQKGIEIIGDIPIYVAFDSADTWAEPALFQLDGNCTPVAVAGCPPDAFSSTGQLWGNPLYDWEYHAKTGYDWWVKRIAHAYRLYDIVRIDHFRGFDEYWSIPYGDSTAVNGKWCKGPGYAIFDVLKKRLGKKQVIAEDLGFLTPSVLKLVKKTGYPGMKVLQFAFGSDESNAYLPHNYISNSVVYTGTHDNDTTLGWYRSLSRKERRRVNAYLQIKRGEKHVEWVLIRAAVSSVADMAIIPMQDYLGLDGSARINLPSTLGNNWKWRMKADACTPKLAEKIRELCQLYGRV